nr:hypothetical protein [Tanacetum cinerariifolium]
MGQEKIQHGCNVDTSRDTNHESGNLFNFPIFPATNEFYSNCEQDVDLEKEDVEVEDDDDGDTYNIWDIKVKDVERIRQFSCLTDEIVNVTMVDEEAAKDPQSYFTEIQVHSVITKLEPFIHTQPMSPLYGIFESYKSSIKPYKVDREMKSPFRSLTTRGWNSRSSGLVLCG